MVDVYFGGRGLVDEERSQITGDVRLLRGLLTRATFRALTEWLSGDATQLRPDQFRNQPFRAEFVLSYASTRGAARQRVTPGHYDIKRTRTLNACLGAVGGAPFLELACAALQVGGVVRRQVSDRYKNQFEILKEQLIDWDQRGLAGVKERARS